MKRSFSKKLQKVVKHAGNSVLYIYIKGIQIKPQIILHHNYLNS